MASPSKDTNIAPYRPSGIHSAVVDSYQSHGTSTKSGTESSAHDGNPPSLDSRLDDGWTLNSATSKPGQSSAISREAIEREHGGAAISALGKNGPMVHTAYLSTLDQPEYRDVKARRERLRANDPERLNDEDYTWGVIYSGVDPSSFRGTATQLSSMAHRMTGQNFDQLSKEVSYLNRAATLIESGQISLDGLRPFCQESRRAGRGWSTLSVDEESATPLELVHWRLHKEMGQIQIENAASGFKASQTPNSSTRKSKGKKKRGGKKVRELREAAQSSPSPVGESVVCDGASNETVAESEEGNND
ncbi:hypothetical protein I316_03533 [Kwoniella heveanensis BCC8398]|uniref:Uncharacterized protein n=1 Tax=Kwoniella heveanensis BCC8398 TaxID=1296120 RepID=A0A1B9GVB3_9TREE|nr:hypothetical protein I316_03533 [Kwoniella heveanensis BCC8398]